MGGVASSNVGLDGDHGSFGGSLGGHFEEVVEENGRILFLLEMEILE